MTKKCDVSIKEQKTSSNFFAKNYSAAKINEEMIAACGLEAALAYYTVRKWVEQFGAGWTSVEDATRCGRVSASITPQRITIIEKLVLDDRLCQRPGWNFRRISAQDSPQPLGDVQSVISLDPTQN